MMPNGIIGITRMMMCLMPVVMVRRLVAIHLHHRNRVVLRGCCGDRDHLVGEARRGSAAECQRETRGRDAEQVGKGDKPSCRDPDSSC